MGKAFSYFFHELAAAAAFAAAPADDEQLQMDMKSAQRDAVASAATVGPAGLGESAPRWAERIRGEQPGGVPTQEALVRQNTQAKHTKKIFYSTIFLLVLVSLLLYYE